MKKVDGIITTTFETDNEGFYIDIVEHKTGDTQWDVWLYHKDICVKEFVIGSARSNGETLESVLEEMETYLYEAGIDGLNFFDLYEERNMTE